MKASEEQEDRLTGTVAVGIRRRRGPREEGRDRRLHTLEKKQ